jgi:RimJ/RimL family protein N-acetyltransferase
VSLADWPGAPVLRSERLSLDPLTVDHAEEMAPLLGDPALYAFTGGSPAGLDELRRRYQRQALGHSEDGAQRWHNWIVRLDSSREPVGAVQATVTAHREGVVAEVAWVIAVPYQRRGYATEAAVTMVRWLRDHGVEVVAANIHPRHEASMRVARALGLAPTDEVIAGEIRWAGGAGDAGSD